MLENTILEYIQSASEPVHVDEIARSLQVSIQDISLVIMQLSFAGTVQEVKPNYYVCKIQKVESKKSMKPTGLNYGSKSITALIMEFFLGPSIVELEGLQPQNLPKWR